MDILQVIKPLVCSQRSAQLKLMPLKVLRSSNGKLFVAVDPVGARPGNWVFTISGSAARYAADDTGILTDLTIGGIIDEWYLQIDDEVTHKQDKVQNDFAVTN